MYINYITLSKSDLNVLEKRMKKIKYLNEIFIKVLTLKVHLVDEEFLDFD